MPGGAKRYERYMRRAIELARAGPSGPFAAVMVDEGAGAIVAEACDQSDRNPTLHDVTGVIAGAFEHDRSPDPSRVTIVCTAEPCSMCASAIVWAGIGRVVFGTSSATLKGLGRLGIDLGIAEVVARSEMRGRIEIVGGVLEDECTALYTADS